MRIRVLSIGKTNMDFVKLGLEQYIGRIHRYQKFSWEELDDVKNAARLNIESLKAAEGELFLRTIKSNEHVILLDENGKSKSSRDFAYMLQEHFNYNSQDICFVIGGAYGFNSAMYTRANQKLTLSKMTFSHQIIRVILCEQIYRAFTIMRGEPYHHD